MAKNGYVYMMRDDDSCVDLVRFKDGAAESFDPDSPGEWRRAPAMDSMLMGDGDWVWYDNVPDEDVEFYEDKIRKLVAKAKKK